MQDIRAMTNKSLLKRAYLLESWGPSPELQRELQELEDRVHAEGLSGVTDAFRAARARGAKAYQAKQELRQVFNTGQERAARQWLVEAKRSWLNDSDIVESLEGELKKTDQA